MGIKTKRRLYCPECDTTIKLQSRAKKGQTFMECPKCDFSEPYKKRNRPVRWFKKGEDF